MRICYFGWAHSIEEMTPLQLMMTKSPGKSLIRSNELLGVWASKVRPGSSVSCLSSRRSRWHVFMMSFFLHFQGMS